MSCYSLLRLLLWAATHTLYRLDIEARAHVPARGGALLVPNHVSMADAAFLIASLDRPVRFLMFKGSYEHALVKPFAKMLQVIPIASDQGPREMIHSLREATQALQNGELVCIFPEGQMTRIGQLLPFRRGMERVIKGVDVPIIPVNLDGVFRCFRAACPAMVAQGHGRLLATSSLAALAEIRRSLWSRTRQ